MSLMNVAYRLGSIDSSIVRSIRSSSSFESPTYGTQELLLGDRRAQVIAQLLQEIPSLLRHPTSREKQESIAEVGAVALRTRIELDARHLRHHDVAEHEVHTPERLQHLERAFARVRGVHLVFAAEDLTERTEQDRVVVDDEDRGALARRPELLVGSRRRGRGH